MFKDCITDIEKNAYKSAKLLKKENDEWLKEYDPEFYRIQRIGSYCDVFEMICNRVEIPTCEERFLHFIDHRYLFDTTRGYRYDNITPDYSLVVNNGLEALKYPEQEITNKFCEDYNRTVDAMIGLAMRVARHEKTDDSEASIKRGLWFEHIAEEPAQDLEEALQRILFFDQMYWQMGQRLMGLGHLDLILGDLYRKGIDDGSITKESALEMIMGFIGSLHEYCWLKSNMLIGDTGQIIILGGRDDSEKYSCNELTFLFIEAIRRMQLPDPKVLLRVSKNMPRELLEQALLCMKSGVGSPILSNDDVVLPILIDYGIPKVDANNYGVAACWEPLIPGKSISVNNIKVLTYPKVMQRLWKNESLDELNTVNDWIEAFYKSLKNEIDELMDIISEERLQYNPYLSLLMHDCKEKKMDVCCGGAGYINYAFTTVGLANTVNTIINLKELVYEKKEYTLSQVRDILMSDYEDCEALRERLKNNAVQYGQDDSAVVELANRIMRYTSEYVSGFRNYMGGRFKVGFSSPAYVDEASGVMASFDGRKSGEPFAVHISSERNNGYTEIVSFASQLDYKDNRFNGNVVDLMISPSFIEDNFEKVITFLSAAIRQGFFQLQMNVVSSATLIAAKKEPEKYMNLIVRVWGFSAYFTQLPESYQDVLIERALENEHRGAAGI